MLRFVFLLAFICLSLLSAADPVVPLVPTNAWERPVVPLAIADDSWMRREIRLPVFGAALVQPMDATLAAIAAVVPVPEDHRLQAGDAIRIVTWGGLNFNETQVLAPGGQLAVPGLGAVPLMGLTRAQAQEAVVAMLRQQFTQAGAVLQVDRAMAQTVTVLGEVIRPGQQIIPGGGTLLDALKAAGGLKPRGSMRRIQIKEPGVDLQTVDLYPMAMGQSLDLLKALRAGTVIAVPLSGVQVQVFGAVKRSAAFELLANEKLSTALVHAGGILPEADPMRLRILRESPQGQNLTISTAADLERETANDGDRLHIGLRPLLVDRFAGVTVEGAVRAPGTYPLTDSATLGNLLEMCGGYLPEADAERALIVRQLAIPQALHLNVGTTVLVHEDLLTGLSATSALMPRDRLVVPVRPPLSESTLRVWISGAVRKPGVFPLVPGMKVSDLLRLSQGIVAEAQVDVADLVRILEDSGRRRVEREAIDLRPLLNGTAQGPELRNGDVLVIRSRALEHVKIRFDGEVANNGELIVPAGTTLSQALIMAGGLSPWAFPEGSFFYRQSEIEAGRLNLDAMIQQLTSAKVVNQQRLAQATDERGRVALQQTLLAQENQLIRMQAAQVTGRMTGVDLAGLLANKGGDFILQDGDRLFVPKHPGTIRIQGEIMTPGAIRFEAGLKVKDVLARAGGPTQLADEARIFVVRANGTVVASAAYSGTAWNAQERRWVRTTLSSIILEEGDTVLVPPDLTYRPDGITIAKDFSQILFQIAGAVGVVAAVSK